MSGEFDGMNQKEIAATTSEWSPPQEMEDWLCTEHARGLVVDLYIEASTALHAELRHLPVNKTNRPFTEIEARAGFVRAAWQHVDNGIDDAYQEYIAMHPYTQGYMTETFARIYGKDGI